MSCRLTQRYICLLAVACLTLGSSSAAETDFNRDVLPILSGKCTQCHGGVKKSSGFTFTDPQSPFGPAKSGAIPVVPGKSEQSELIVRITSTDDDERMPPEGDPLSEEEVEILKRWIDSGAKWEQHWAFQARDPGDTPLTRLTTWPMNPIDHYVLEKLEAAEITPSPEADRYTLIRRVALDLTGLPPTIEQVDTFADDQSPDAYEQMVDRFLTSPHFGERWARHWLDQARYADSDGYEKDNARSDAWRWRQWVIDAINRDLPFDQFTTEQIAGDLIPEGTPEQHLATAFHRQTLFNREGGVDPEEDRTKRVIDRATTTSAAWLGLTIQCTQCHDHPYDPITQKEFYQFYAFFNNANEATVSLPRVGAEKLALRQEEIDLVKAREDSRSALQTWLKEMRSNLAHNVANPLQEHPVEILEATTRSGTKLERQNDASLLASGKPESDVFTLRIKIGQPAVSALKLELLPDERLPNRGPGRADNGNFVLSQLIVDGHRLDSADASFGQGKFDINGALTDEEKTGWAIAPQMGKSHAALFRFENPIANPGEITVRLVQNYGARHTIGRFRILAISGNERPVDVPEHLRPALADPNPEQLNQIEDYYFSTVHPTTSKLIREFAESKKRNRMEARVVRQRTNNPRPTYIFHRGDFLQPKKELGAMTASPPAVAQRFEAQDATRLDLAEWIVAEENPLTARVVANNIWSHFFGEGIVETLDDFGTRGAPPSHPQLLDWLAEEFIKDGWSRKALIKTILMSRTYRQSSVHRAETKNIDPNNRLLHRQNRLRAEAEIIRDLHLSVSGLLSARIGGESVFPPIPADVAAQSYASSAKWNTSTGADRYRRGMYTFFKRTAPDPNLMTFDCPDSNVAVSARSKSNTPLMALATLQNEVFHEAAQAFANRVLGDPDLASDSERLARAFRLCVSRPPSDAELETLTKLLTDNRKFYTANPDQAIKLAPKDHSEPIEAAAWVATLRIITNLDEFITRN